jgi:hypothetical protein
VYRFQAFVRVAGIFARWWLDARWHCAYPHREPHRARGGSMPRIRLVELDEAAPFTRNLMERDLAQHGYVYPGTGIYGHAPTIQEGARALDAGITGAGRIDQQLRKLMNVRAAQLVGCPF